MEQAKQTTVSPGWATRLTRLRGVGLSRTSASSAYAALTGKLSRGSVLLDIGCGDSNDRFIALSRGVTSYGVDLFPPIKRATRGFVRADARRLPFGVAMFDAAVCQALIALIPPDDRFEFYLEVGRVLKPGGWLALSVYPLTDGWRVKREEESQRIFTAGFSRICSGLYQKGDVHV